ncbi:MAG: phosphoenolpyruvate carboxylase, partial [Terrimicrobiaceae bacterium]|nr:phosphoenolpyruvate carboxylase [Terrimicrobiaceae bacterium]
CGLLEELRARAPSARAGASEEPWKLAAQLMAEGVEQELYASPAELDAQLRVLGSSLEEVGAGRLARSEVWPVRRLLHVFGFHLARLDIRQNSAFHDRAIAQILAAAGEEGADYPAWPEQRRLEFLERELRSPRPFLFDARRAGPEAAAVLDCYAVLRREIQAHGPGGIGALIVSMTRSLSDLLGVYLLAREGGLLEPTTDGPVCHLPVVPLFETLEDLEHAPDLLGQFLDHPLTQRSLRARADGAGNRGLIQQVMIGYSDSNKDCGILASQHALRQAQAEMAEAAAGRGVWLVFFHGRGGTTSRGAGPTHRFLAALPKGTVCGHLRLTEQGETIAQKYSKISTAVH